MSIEQVFQKASGACFNTGRHTGDSLADGSDRIPRRRCREPGMPRPAFAGLPRPFLTGTDARATMRVAF
jgi:hypothetical protein